MGDNGEGLLISSGVAELILVKPELSLKIQSSPHLKSRTIYFYSRAAASLTELFVVVLLVGETFFQFLVLFIFLLGRQFSNLVNYQPRSGRSADDAFVH